LKNNNIGLIAAETVERPVDISSEFFFRDFCRKIVVIGLIMAYADDSSVDRRRRSVC